MKTLIKDSKIWHWAMFSFVLAGLTGFLYRLGFVVALPVEINLENVRHAHSHLMFFGWASLLPLYFIKMDMVPGYHASIGTRLMRAGLWGVILFGFLSFPFFLIWGYKSVLVGDVQLPFSVILSAFVMISWYVFMAGYIYTRQKKLNFKPNVWFEGALLMLFVSSLGAWGVGALQMLGIGGPLLGKALTHFFLATFVEGWVILVLLGLIAKALNLREGDFLVSPIILVALIAFGSPLTFPYGISESMVSINLSVAARVGGVLVAEGVILFLCSVFKNQKREIGIWIWPLLFLGMKAIMQVIAAVSPTKMWLSEHGIRILYLHVLLLGAFSTGVTVYLMEGLNIKKRYFYGFLASVAAVIISLVMMTSFWPSILSGAWGYTVLAIAATFPVLAILLFWGKMYKLVTKQL